MRNSPNYGLPALAPSSATYRLGSTLPSLLDRLPQGQTERNIAGRARFDHGTLHPSPETRWLDPAQPLLGEDFIYVPDFLTADECATLLAAADQLADRQAVENVALDYWRGRILFHHDVAAALPQAGAIMYRARAAAIERIARHYAVSAPIYADTVQLVRWPEGMHMPPHCDKENADGKPHSSPHRNFASIVYLNDDYEGGEFYLTARNIVIKPRAGALVAFTSGWHHEHAVLTIRRGTRITMPAFYTFDPAFSQHGLPR
jgi:predicted 2-oxoglutarate/Fe(II)-dependent dioxygenase YbiX